MLHSFVVVVVGGGGGGGGDCGGGGDLKKKSPPPPIQFCNTNALPGHCGRILRNRLKYVLAPEKPAP